MSFPQPIALDSNAFPRSNQYQQHIFLWGAVGLTPKQVLVLKSMMRLLDHRLHHKWFYSSTTMDLCVNAEECLNASASGYQDATGNPPHVLAFGVNKKDQTDCLCLPLYVDDLLQTINRVGHTIQLKKSAATEAALLGRSGLSSAFLRLERWPPAHLLSTPDRIRMASLLTGRSLVLQELQRRSGHPLAVCEAFIQDLDQAGLLQSVQVLPHAVLVSTQAGAAESPTVASPIKSGLLDKIRARLGLRRNT